MPVEVADTFSTGIVGRLAHTIPTLTICSGYWHCCRRLIARFLYPSPRGDRVLRHGLYRMFLLAVIVHASVFFFLPQPPALFLRWCWCCGASACDLGRASVLASVSLFALGFGPPPFGVAVRACFGLGLDFARMLALLSGLLFFSGCMDVSFLVSVLSCVMWYLRLLLWFDRWSLSLVRSFPSLCLLSLLYLLIILRYVARRQRLV